MQIENRVQLFPRAQGICFCLCMTLVVGLSLSSSASPTTSARADPDQFSSEDDYGCGLDMNETRQPVSAASHQESVVKIETMHYLDNPSKELSSLLAYPHVMAAYVKYNTTLPVPQRNFTSSHGCYFSTWSIVSGTECNKRRLRGPGWIHIRPIGFW